MHNNKKNHNLHQSRQKGTRALEQHDCNTYLRACAALHWCAARAPSRSAASPQTPTNSPLCIPWPDTKPTAKPTDVSLCVQIKQIKQTFVRKRQNNKRTWLTSVAKILFMWPPKLRSKDHIRLAKSSFCIRMRSRACTSWWWEEKNTG